MCIYWTSDILEYTDKNIKWLFHASDSKSRRGNRDIGNKYIVDK